MEKGMKFTTEEVKAILDGRKTQTRRVVKPQPSEDMDFVGIYSTEKMNIGRAGFSKGFVNIEMSVRKPCEVGDIIWVRETWNDVYDIKGMNQPPRKNSECDKFYYKADYEDGFAEECIHKWRPSIHMPRKAARIFLKVAGVRVERLQDITEEDAIKEGINRLFHELSQDEFERWATNRRNFSGSETGNKDEQPWCNYLWHGNENVSKKIIDSWDYQCSAYDSAILSFSSLWQSMNPKEGLGWNDNPWVWVIDFERV